METEAPVEPQADVVQEMVQQDVVPEVEQEIHDESEQVSEKQVPLSALIKQRKRAQELELELQWERQRNTAQKPVEEDNSKYESATREDLSNAQEEAVRIVEERIWMKQNPEKLEKINEFLPQFLKQRPNLAQAINSATNRYEEAYTLMEALTPKQQQQIKSANVVKKQAPGAPTGVPKAASLNQAVDVMSMSDSEFHSWRQAQKKRR